MKGPHSQETKDKISKAKIKYLSLISSCKNCKQKFTFRPNKWHPVRVFCSKICKNKLGGRRGMPLSVESKEALSKKYRGSGNPVWKGGASLLRKRMSYEEKLQHRKWREIILKRDDYTCVKCHLRKPDIQADHIKPWFLFPELRNNIENGQTLCRKCHLGKTSLELKKYWKNQYGTSNFWKHPNVSLPQVEPAEKGRH